MTKKATKKPAAVSIHNCTFHGAQQSNEADMKRYEAVKAIADALHEAAKAIGGPQGSVGLMLKSSD